MIYTNANLKICMAAPREIYTQWRDERAEEGFRTVSISLTGPTSVPIYTAVMVKRDPPFRSRSWSRLSKDELTDKIAEMEALDPPLRPYVVAATGSGSDVVYAAAFREMASKPRIRLTMSPGTYVTENETQRAADRILLWVDSFGTAGDIRYCAIWGDNPDRIAWNSEAINDSGDARQQRFEAMRSIKARPSLIAYTPAGGLARLFVDSRLKHGWSSLPDMSGDAFQKACDEEQAEGRFPIRIATTVINGAVRFSAIFAKSDEILPRTFRIRGPDPIGLDAANRAKAAKIDEWMEAYVRDNNLRGAAIAVVDGTRLVYAKGYTFAEAEPHYQDIEPTTLFRMASVSKTFAALAAWKGLADSPHSRGTKMQALLALKRTDGTTPPAPFGDIRIRHLLESNSGIDQWSVRGTVYDNADNPNGAAQPLSKSAIEKAVADKTMPGTPGQLNADGKHATQYGRTDYILLGWIAAKLAGTGGFNAAIKKLLLDPLHMSRTRGARSKIEDRGDDEAMHHSPTLATGISAVHGDRRIVPIPYGRDNYELYGGAAGVSSAVIDVARLGAMLNCRIGNPVFSTAVLDDLLSDAVEATSQGSDHGYHGFDGATDNGGVITVSKGGSLTGVGSGLWGKTGKRFIAIARNGEKVEGAPEDWKNGIDDLAKLVNWGTGDLFPQFGMPTLG